MTRRPRTLQLLAVAALLGMLGSAAMIFIFAPQDAVQGPVQRIFYLHVSSAIAAYFCFALVLGGCIHHLIWGGLAADRLARAAALVGLVFTINCVVMGIIWAKPIWNWDPTQTWDARFTSTVVMGMVYAGYLLVRRFASPGRQAMRLSAVVGIIGFIDVPVVHFSVQWWRTLHPGPIIEENALPPAMLVAFLVTMVCTLFLAAVLVAIRYRLEQIQEERESSAEGAPELELVTQR
ncbi:MAG TPA: cytochrome c biogenesis protein [Candidatus Acidoferrales bacterium]|nr:cytochrome c biogenesis protein [Candidatus Acidoferrales bacterium]